MAVQGASLQRQGHLPVWPILGLVVLALAAAIGLTVLNEVRTTAPATTTQPVAPVVVPQSAIWASSAAIRDLHARMLPTVGGGPRVATRCPRTRLT